jgi:molybdopterin biosynthesis enzyme
VSDKQQIEKLAPLADALRAIDTLAIPVAARDVGAGEAVGRVLAADVRAVKLPAMPTALRDGFAVRAEELSDAGGYAPVVLAKLPPFVETGDELPSGTDAVASPETILIKGNAAEVLQSVTAGEGIVPSGGETGTATELRKAGERVRNVDAAVFEAAGIARVSVRVPQLQIAVARQDPRLLPALHMIAHDCAALGGEPLATSGMEMDAALRSDGADAVIIIGGTGTGQRDRAVVACRAAGKVTVHGVGLAPGQSAAIGSVGPRPALLLPGRLDAALAAWLVLGRHLLGRLDGSNGHASAAGLTLTRKITSTVGLAEVVPVRRDGSKAEPLATQHLPLSALSRADGWVLVPPDSEGFAAGSLVAVNDWL